MPAAVVDTTVLYAACNRSAHRHVTGLEIVRAADHADIPMLRIPDVVLVETMNGLVRDVGHDTATDVLERLEASEGFTIDRVTEPVWHGGLDVFRSIERLSLADGIIAAYLREHGLEYLYSFDTGFDGLPAITRLPAAEDPYQPDR